MSLFDDFTLIPLFPFWDNQLVEKKEKKR